MKKVLLKILNWIKNNKLYVCSFIAALVSVSIIYGLNDVTPFGGKSLLCVDFYHQYGPMLAEFYDRIHHSSNLIYSFNMAMGLPFFRNFLNYMSSPFNIIMFFFPRSGVITSYSFIIGLKAVASCVTMVYYLSKKFKCKELYLIPLGLIYAFSAYFSAYYWNIMWLDGMVMTPLITYGIEKIVNKKEWKYYSITLAIMLIANYFIGYMLCIYSVVYFILYLIYKTKFVKKNIKGMLKDMAFKTFLFIFGSLIGGMLTFCLLLPMAYSMTSISATGGTMPTSQYYAFEFIDYIKGHLTGVTTTTFASDDITNPNISCGILSVALLLAYLINVDIPLKNKVCYILAIGFFIAAFFIPQLDYILHAFHVPNDLPYRYSFLYSFLLVVIGSYGLINIRKIKFPLVAIGYVLLMVLLLTCTQESWADIDNNMLYINMILLTLYFIFYSAIYFLNSMHTLFYVALTVVAMIDVIVSINYNWDITQELDNFYSDYDLKESVLNYVEEHDNENFYRIEDTATMTLNDGSWYDYKGLTTFSSMAYESMAILQHNLGMPGNEINSYIYVQSTPIYDLMMDIKYFIGTANDYTRYEDYYSEDYLNVVKNDYNVGLVFGVKNDLLKWDSNIGNPFDIQEEFIKDTTGIENVLSPATAITAEEIYKSDSLTLMKYTYENTFDNFYLYSNSYSNSFMLIGSTIYYSDESYYEALENIPDLQYTNIEDYSDKKVINISSTEDYITLYVGYNYYVGNTFQMYYIDQSKFEEAYNYLNNYKMDITSFKESDITGNITLDDNMMVYTSIPYDDGWHVYVDGKETTTYELSGALLAFDCASGTHKIEIKYSIPYFGIGMLFTIISATILITDTFFKDKILIKIDSLPKKEKKDKKKKKDKATKKGK